MNFDALAAVKIRQSDVIYFAGLNDLGEKYELHVGAGRSYYPIKKDEIEIVKTYNYDQCWDAELEFVKDFGPEPQTPCARLGWIAPNGDFYPCAYVAHNDLGEKLFMKLYGESGGNYYGEMEKRGWIGVKGGGIFTIKEKSEGRYQITPAQKETLLKITEAFEKVEFEQPDFDWDAELLKNPEGYALQNWFTLPAGDLHGQTFAQALRESYELYCGDYMAHIGVENVVTPAPYAIKRIGEHPGD